VSRIITHPRPLLIRRAPTIRSPQSTIHSTQHTPWLETSSPLPSLTSSYVRVRSSHFPELIIPISIRLAVIHPSSLTFTQNGVGLARSALYIDQLVFELPTLSQLPSSTRYPYLSLHPSLLHLITSSRLLDCVILTHFVTRSSLPSLRSCLSNQNTKVLYLPGWTPTNNKKYRGNVKSVRCPPSSRSIMARMSGLLVAPSLLGLRYAVASVGGSCTPPNH
jgi:hypothetical protein